MSNCLKQHGVRPAFLLDRLGLLNERALLAHGVHLDEAELDLIAERGAILVTNPVSNMKLAVGGVFPYAKAAARGIPMALGTDGAASNNSLDLFQELKIFALIQKHADVDPTALPALDAWQVATGRRAHLFGEKRGRLEIGAPADLLLLQRNAVEMTPTHRFHSNLVYSATGSVVDSMIVAGRVVMRHRKVPGEEEILEQAKACAARIVKRVSF